MSGGARYAGFGLAFLATAGILFATAFREWKRNNQISSDRYIDRIYICEGLWLRCTVPISGQFQCDTFDVATIGLPPQLQGMRAMMCLATIFIGLATCISILTLPCTASLTESKKKSMARVGGCMALVAGALCLAAVSWYAADVIYEFWSVTNLNNPFKYEFGSSLYVGWVSSGIALIAGILMTCCTCGETDESDVDTYRYNYKPPQAAKSSNRNTEYV